MQFTVPLSQAGSIQIFQAEETLIFPATASDDITVPVTATALQFYASLISGTGTIAVQVVGDQSGSNYTNGFENIGGTGLVVPINTAVDQSFTVTWETFFGGNGTWLKTIAADLSTVGNGPAKVTVTCNCTTGGGMLAYGIYQCTNDGTTGAMTWSVVVEKGATMLQADTMTFDFPTGSVVLATLDAGVELPPGATYSFVDTAVGNMAATADNAAGAANVGIPLSASYDFDQSVDASTQFNATATGGPAFNNAAILVLSAFTSP